MNMTTKAVMAASALWCILAVGCVQAQMVVPAQLQVTGASLSVKKQGGMFSTDAMFFGPYRVRDIDDGWVSSDTQDNGRGSSRSDRTHEYNFKLETMQGQRPHQARCVSRATETTSKMIGGIENIDHSGQTTTCRISGPTGQGQLSLRPAPRSGTLVGHIEMDDLKLTIAAQHEAKDVIVSLSEPLGYIIKHEGQVVGAVQSEGDDLRVFIAPQAKEPIQDAVALASAALLLRQQI